MKYIQPRPSSIVAALYTARDLKVDLAILHGPSGCSFKHARLLEEDGLRVLTTSLSDNEFIFGGHERLAEVLTYAEKTFSPSRIAVIGTCVSMIIGEDMNAAIEAADLFTEAISVDIHAGFSENIDGVILTLQAAADAGWIGFDELERQKTLLAAANEVERLYGAASLPYIEPSRGDLKHVAGQALMAKIADGSTGLAIMNAKKETAYMFADILLALHDVAPDAPIQYAANLDNRGLPKVRRDAEQIRTELETRGVFCHIKGALDEYGATGEEIGRWILEENPDFVVLSGVPHAIPKKYTEHVECFSITNGPRQVEPLRTLGHAHVMVEIDLHPKTLGVSSIVESEFGAILRSLK